MEQTPFKIVGITFFLLYIILPLVLGWLHIISSKGVKTAKRSVNIFLGYYVVIGVGIQGLVSAVYQLFFPKIVASYVGWPYSPFLLEVGMANLSYGILGIVSIWFREGWRTATAVGYAIFLICAAIGHIVSIVTTGNWSLGNAGPTLWIDILLPIALFILLILRLILKKREA